METEIRIFPREKGEHQRVALVRPGSWAELDFLSPKPTDNAFSAFVHIYRAFLVPSAPQLFGDLVLFQLPEDMELPAFIRSAYGDHIGSDLTMAAMALRASITVTAEGVEFHTQEIRGFWDALVRRDCVAVVRGERGGTQVIPMSRRAGYLTESQGRMKVNSSFFIMDPIDCATVYDHIGTPFGLMVKGGAVHHPPLFDREALLVSTDGAVSIQKVSLTDLGVAINGKVYRHGVNARFYARPHHSESPEDQRSVVIIGNRVEAVWDHGTQVPASGFVLCPDEPCDILPGATVTYTGMEQVAFGLQVGNPILKDGEVVTEFTSPFYDVRRRETAAFPPSLYPLDFEYARAARIGLGADSLGRPMILWAEGAAKFGHRPGVDSCGASLSEMGQICQAVGMYQAINLDGGGSAQLLVEDHRPLQISDRNTDFTQSQRPVPMGLVVI